MIDPLLLALLAGWLCLTVLFTLMGLLSERRAAWWAYPFLFLYWSFPSMMLEHTMLYPWALGLIALHALAFPPLRILARRGVWGKRQRALGLAIAAKCATWSRSGGGVSIRGMSSFGSSSRASSGTGSAGGGSSSGSSHSSFSGGGGGFGGGGASGMW